MRNEMERIKAKGEYRYEKIRDPGDRQPRYVHSSSRYASGLYLVINLSSCTFPILTRQYGSCIALSLVVNICKMINLLFANKNSNTL